MSTKSKGQEHFEKLSKAEKLAIYKIIELESSEERLKHKTSSKAEEAIEDIISHYSMQWEQEETKNDI